MPLFPKFYSLDEEKMQEHLSDMAGDPNTVSNCCGAMIYADTDICSWCKEHCDSEELV